MKKNLIIGLLISVIVSVIVCLIAFKEKEEIQMEGPIHTSKKDTKIRITPTTSSRTLEEGLSVIRYDDEYGFQEFLENGGASSDEDVINYLMDYVIQMSGLNIMNGMFGCSTVLTQNKQQEILFGRNFDWEKSDALIVESHSPNAYASISTVNLDFIQSGTSISINRMPDDILAQIALYAPLDGMNEKGLAISVNMIEDSEVIKQSKASSNLTTTTAIRLILNQAEDVDDAIAILQEYNMHSSMNMMIHFAIADAKGNSVVVEYINNQMQVIYTPVVTNFYLAEGEKQGIGSAQSHERFDILMDVLDKNQTMEMQDVKDALDRVSKDNFNEFESTEWSIVYNLAQKEIHYYHRENYDRGYVLHIDE